MFSLNVEKIREDFSILNKTINNKPIIYMDSACVTLKPKQVVEKINQYYNEFPACAGRSTHKLGKKVTEEVEQSRKTIQKFINAKKQEEIIFTRNTTEGINLIANSLGLEGKKVLGTSKEHNSNLLPWLNGNMKYDIVKDKDNDFNFEEFNEKIKNTKLVAMRHTSNLDGTTIPAKEIIKIAHENQALVLLDAAQSIPHKEVDVKKLDVDFLAFSGHKMLGPSGTGILYGKYDLLENLKTFMLGGETVFDSNYDSFKLEKPPEKFEAGLQNYAGIIGLAEAARYLTKIGKDKIEKHEIKLNNMITEELNKIPEIDILGPNVPESRSGIISFNIKNTDPHNVASMLDASNNIMVRSGAHCVHSWFNANKLKGSARASLYIYNTEEEADIFVKAVKDLVKIVK
ncbi:aminotransferase class V-fold PLP-dependent enzyme [Candidatus Woesearchaeota archaeon]|nr:aminotransferase class V-fold PLP-dependent enzyme [Candidatus Woesearchaeota archaeon]